MRHEFKFNKPKYEQQFEDLCQKILEHKFGYLRVDRYGRKGQKQHGIDIVAKYQKTALAIQCKHYTSINPRSLEAIKKDIFDFQRAFSIQRRPFKVDELVIATSCSRDVQAINLIQSLNENSSSSDEKIPVSIKFWEDIEDLLNTQSDVADWYNNSPSSYTPRRKRSGAFCFCIQETGKSKLTLTGLDQNSSITITLTKDEVVIRFKDTKNAWIESEALKPKAIIGDLFSFQNILEILDLLRSQVTKKFSIHANDISTVIKTPDGRGLTTVKIIDATVIIDDHKELNRSKQKLYRELVNEINQIRNLTTIIKLD